MGTIILFCWTEIGITWVKEEVADVYVNVVQEIESDILKNITHVVGIQPDHPDRKTNVDELLEYVVSNKYDDLVTFDSVELEMVQWRVTKKEFVQSGMMSRRVGSYLDNCTNIHSEEDLKMLKRIL